MRETVHTETSPLFSGSRLGYSPENITLVILSTLIDQYDKADRHCTAGVSHADGGAAALRPTNLGFGPTNFLMSVVTSFFSDLVFFWI